MHGLVNQAIASFVADSFGPSSWQELLRDAGLKERFGTEGFDTFEDYDDDITLALTRSACRVLGRPEDCLLEDLGTYLVSHPRMAPLRRLLRFGGVSFADALRSFDELPSRANLAVSDLRLPELELQEIGSEQFNLVCRECLAGFGHVLIGMLRALADDYGALVTLEHIPQAFNSGPQAQSDLSAREMYRNETIAISLFDTSFHVGRSFSLAEAKGR